MNIKIICFTDKGYSTGNILKDVLISHESELIKGGSLQDICRAAFEQTVPLIFVGASGIAVRSIAPYVKDKLTDPPVLVVDELGRFVIPLLSGHAGGANKLAAEIADAIGAIPAITTATDINGAFPVDVFAVENGLSIVNREGIAKVSSAALEGRPVTICIKDFPAGDNVDVLIADEEGQRIMKDAATIVLSPKRYALGIGCRRGKSFEEIKDHVLRVLDANNIALRDVGCIATIDIKKDEEGLKALSQAWRMPLITFDAALLRKAPGDFTTSETVLERVGVDNVCERAAALAAGPGATIVVRKTADNGITAAIAAVKQP